MEINDEDSSLVITFKEERIHLSKLGDHQLAEKIRGKLEKIMKYLQK